MKNFIFVVVLVLVLVVLEAGCASQKDQEQQTSAAQVEPYVDGSFDELGEALHALEVFLDSVTTTTTTTTTTMQSRIIEPEQFNQLSIDANVWDQLAFCETRGNWNTNTGNGFGGGLQFAHSGSWSTWRAFGGEEFATHPWDATREQQIVVAERVLNSSGWNAWPGCARQIGLL